MMEFPITTSALLSVAGIALFGGLVTQWLKQYISKPLLVNALCLALCLVAALASQFIEAAWQPTGAQIMGAMLVGFFGASLATFGFETISNIVKLQRPPA